MIEIDPDAQEYLLQGPIPGQSLTNSKEAPYAWEQPPRYTSIKEATEVIFFEMLKDENLETLSTMMMDGVPITDIKSYEVKKDYYWAMGDNRDDSLDSRYWGFIPRDYILGEALFSWFSINLKTGFPRFNRIGNVIQ